MAKSVSRGSTNRTLPNKNKTYQTDAELQTQSPRESRESWIIDHFDHQRTAVTTPGYHSLVCLLVFLLFIYYIFGLAVSKTSFQRLDGALAET